MPSILVAYDSNYGIGKDGKIPWKCPEDMRRFKEITMGNIIIMGRKTAESIKSLPGRYSIILTRGNPIDDNCLDGFFIDKNSLEAALKHCEIFPEKKVYIIGGAEVYREALEKQLVDRVYATKIDGTYNCDTFFPVDQIPKDWYHHFEPGPILSHDVWQRLS